MPSIAQIQKHRAVDEVVSDEPGEYFVYLTSGYQIEGQGNDVEGCHCFGADSLKEITDVLRNQVTKCECQSCVNSK